MGSHLLQGVDLALSKGYLAFMSLNQYPLLTHCPICHTSYPKEAVKLVEEREQARQYHSMCQNCGHGLLAYVLEISGGISSLGLVTDASCVDLVRLADRQPIGSDECMEAHRLLTQNSQGVCRRLLDMSGKLA